MKSSHPRAFDRRFYGVVEGIVEEIVDPDKEGRVKVKFPWYDDDTVTEWCRVRQLYAGPGYGTFFVPEKGDEVLVGGNCCWIESDGAAVLARLSTNGAFDTTTFSDPSRSASTRASPR